MEDARLILFFFLLVVVVVFVLLVDVDHCLNNQHKKATNVDRDRDRERERKKEAKVYLTRDSSKTRQNAK